MSLYLPLVNMTLPGFNGSCVGAAATQFLGYLHRGAVAAPVLVELGKRGVEHLVIHRCPSTGKVVDIWLLLFLGWRHNGGQAVDRVTGKSADRLSDHHVDPACHAVFDQAVEFLTLLRVGPRDAVVGVNACQLPAGLLLNILCVMLDLSIVACCLLVGLRVPPLEESFWFTASTVRGRW